MGSPWKVLLGSVAGTSHEQRGEACQDYCHAVVVPGPSGPVLVAACADGAGSASRSADGAKLACLGYVHVAAEALRAGERPGCLDEARVLAWYERARRRLSLEACLTGLPLREFACTLLTAVVAETWSLFAQVGDGAIVYGDGDGYCAAGWPQSGEYASTTFFLTGEDYDRRLSICKVERPVAEVALLTDGLQPLALHYASQSVHAPFFEPMFRSLKAADRPESLEEPLHQFLNSRPVNDRTDDDKTLILATR